MSRPSWPRSFGLRPALRAVLALRLAHYCAALDLGLLADRHGLASRPEETAVGLDRRRAVGVVGVDGADYQIADIGLRMLTPRELFRAQGFPETYEIAVGHDGRKFTKAQQVKACGISVCPPLARAMVSANVGELVVMEQMERAA